MGTAWFGPVSRPSGTFSSPTSHWIRPLAWVQCSLLLLSSFVLGLLLWSSTPSVGGPFKKLRGSWKNKFRSLPMNTQSWSQRGLKVTITERPLANQPPVVTATVGHQSISAYTVLEVKNFLLEQGVEADEPVMEWLWALQEQGHE